MIIKLGFAGRPEARAAARVTGTLGRRWLYGTYKPANCMRHSSCDPKFPTRNYLQIYLHCITGKLVKKDHLAVKLSNISISCFTAVCTHAQNHHLQNYL